MDRDTLLEAFFPDDIDNPPPAYFEAMRRLRLEPPSEATVERIAEISATTSDLKSAAERDGDLQ